MSSMSLLLADGRLPVGGHTQSAGLEPAVQAGLSREEVPGLLLARLRTTVAVDAGAAVVALHLVRSTGDPAPALRAWEARTPSDVVRRAQVHPPAGSRDPRGESPRPAVGVVLHDQHGGDMAVDRAHQGPLWHG